MLLFSTYLTVVLFLTKDAQCLDDKHSSLALLTSLFSKIASNIFLSTPESGDGTSNHTSSNLTNVNNSLDLITKDPKYLNSSKVSSTLWSNHTNGTLAEHLHDHLSVVADLKQKTLKKIKWKDKTQLKNNKFIYEKDKEEDYQERLNQLDELYDLQNPDEELKDEAHDAEIFKAIYTSVMYHKKTWVKRFFDKFTGKRRVKRDEEVVCYKDLGCFRDEGPFDYFDMLPNSPEEINTKFILHTNENSKREHLLSYTNASTILNSNFKATRKTKVIIHGFGSSCHRIWVQEMRETFLKMEDVNIICVQWEDGASTPNYVKAASNTRLVGAQVALFLDLMTKVTNMSLDDVHLIGFSLGAHVSGYAGQRLKGIGRISGLDPAGPLFESFPPNMRLDASDANFVDVIHTNADSLLWGGLGAYDPMGHVDFYPNGGRVQKGCKNLFVGGVSDILWPKEGDGRYLCNHRRGYKYFMESVIPVCQFPAFPCRDYETFMKGECFPCKDCGSMGYYADKSPARGQMFLVTRDTEPFCANQYKIELWHSGGPPTTDSVSTQGRFDVTFVSHDGKNETIEVTRDSGKKMHAGSRTVAIIVLHVALSIIANLQVQYTSYRGWISSGFNRWAIDKMSIMSSNSKIQSFCHRGLTMESGLTMVFPLVPGDCNPRELTLHPLPVPWPGIDYNKNVQNGVQYFPSVPPKHPPPVNTAYNFTTPTDSHSPNHEVHPPGPSQNKPHENPMNKIPPPSRPKDVTTTFSVIYDLPTHLNDTTLKTILENVTGENAYHFQIDSLTNVTVADDEEGEEEFNSSLTPMMTEEEYLAWRDAPPPNLEASTYMEKNTQKGTEKLPSMAANHHPVNVIPSHRLSHGVLENHNYHQETKLEFPSFHFEFDRNITRHKGSRGNSSVIPNQNRHPSMIREDAQIKEHKDSPRKYYDNHHIEESKVEIDYYHPSIPNENRHTDKIENKKLDAHPHNDKFHDYDSRNIYADLLGGKGVAEDPPFNSVIDGEIPFKERARAMKLFHSPLNLHSVPEAKHPDSPNFSVEFDEINKGVFGSTRNPSENKNTRPDINSSDNKDSNKGKEKDTSQNQKHSFSISHAGIQSDSLDQDSNPFSYGFYTFGTPQTFKASNLKGLHTLPPTVLKPPAINLIKNYQEDHENNFSLHQSQKPRIVPPPPLQPTQYSNFYAQHRYYPRPPIEMIQEDTGEQFSESEAIPLFESDEPIFIHSEHPSGFHASHPHPFFSSYTPQPTKAPKRQFNPLSFLSSLRQKKEGRFTRPLKALFSQHKDSQPSEPRAHPDRFPSYYVPIFSPSVEFSSVAVPPSYKRHAIPTHLRAPPLSESRGIPEPQQISRMDTARILEIVGPSLEEPKLLRRSKSINSQQPLRPSPKVRENPQPYPHLTRTILPNTKTKFIPIRVSRSSSQKKNFDLRGKQKTKLKK